MRVDRRSRIHRILGLRGGVSVLGSAFLRHSVNGGI